MYILLTQHNELYNPQNVFLIMQQNRKYLVLWLGLDTEDVTSGWLFKTKWMDNVPAHASRQPSYHSCDVCPSLVSTHWKPFFSHPYQVSCICVALTHSSGLKRFHRPHRTALYLQ